MATFPALAPTLAQTVAPAGASGPGLASATAPAQALAAAQAEVGAPAVAARPPPAVHPAMLRLEQWARSSLPPSLSPILELPHPHTGAAPVAGKTSTASAAARTNSASFEDYKTGPRLSGLCCGIGRSLPPKLSRPIARVVLRYVTLRNYATLRLQFRSKLRYGITLRYDLLRY